MKLTRITINNEQMGGVPCIRNLRIPVATIIGLIAKGKTVNDIIEDYPDLEADDIQEALLFAAKAVEERQIPIAPER